MRSWCTAAVVALCGAMLATAGVADAATSTHSHRLTVLRGSGAWTVDASLDRHPLRQANGPAPHARPQRRRPGCAAATTPGRKRTGGEGVLTLIMSAPGTSWRSSTDTAVTLDVTVDGGPTQQVVLFDGGQPFRYQSFLGRLTTGRHCVRARVDGALSHDAAPPVVDLYAVSLGVVPRGSPSYQLLTHAPVMFGRTTSATRNAQLLTYGTATKDANGRDTDVAYTVIWTREDVGDGVVPAYEWGLWGRMTDIETVLHERVAPDGKVRAAQYLSCGCESEPTYPDAVPAPPVGSEDDVAYPTAGTPRRLGRHLVLRDATGNNDMSPYGTSSYRFQQLPVAGPPPRAMREVTMDRHPWTYRLSNDEVARSTTRSSDPRSLLAGDYPQYLIVDIDAAAKHASSIAVEVRLRGDSTWYSNDYAQTTAPGPPSSFPFYDGGHARTVIKLPPGWHGTPITALRLRLDAPAGGPTPTLSGTPHIRLVEVTRHYRIRHPAAPRPTVVTGTQLLPGLPS